MPISPGLIVTSAARSLVRVSVILTNRNLGRRETHELELVRCLSVLDRIREGRH